MSPESTSPPAPRASRRRDRRPCPETLARVDRDVEALGLAIARVMLAFYDRARTEPERDRIARRFRPLFQRVHRVRDRLAGRPLRPLRPPPPPPPPPAPRPPPRLAASRLVAAPSPPEDAA